MNEILDKISKAVIEGDPDNIGMLTELALSKGLTAEDTEPPGILPFRRLLLFRRPATRCLARRSALPWDSKIRAVARRGEALWRSPDRATPDSPATGGSRIFLVAARAARCCLRRAERLV